MRHHSQDEDVSRRRLYLKTITCFLKKKTEDVFIHGSDALFVSRGFHFKTTIHMGGKFSI
jgi:hypothetical protein